MATTKATNLGHRTDVTLKGTTTTVDSNVVVSDTTTINNTGDDVGLKINSTSTGHIMQLQDDSTDVMVVADGGNVGIGTSPSYKMDTYDTLGDYVRFATDNLTVSSIASGILLAARNFLGAIVNYSSVESHISDRTSGSEKGDLVFKNIDSGTTYERMRIKSSGSLEISGTEIINNNTSTNAITLKNISVDETFSGIMEVDQWYLTNAVGGGYITTNWARNNFTGFSKIGTGLTQSSGEFSFPRTGIYEIISSFVFTESTGGNDANVSALLTVSDDNGSTFDNVCIMRSLHLDNSYETMSSSTFILNVNSISGTNAVKIKFLADSINSGNFISGSTSYMETNFSIKRLGPAQ